MTDGINSNNWPDDNSNPQNDVSAVFGVDSGRCLLKNCSNIQDNIFIFPDTESGNVHVFNWINDNIQSGSYLHKLTQSKKVNVMKTDCSVKMTKAESVLLEFLFKINTMLYL